MSQIHAAQRPGTAVARYLVPASWQAALELLADAAATGERDQALVIAGCTDVATEIARGKHPDGLVLVDVSHIDFLGGAPEIAKGPSNEPANEPASVRLKPLTTHADVACAPDAVGSWLPLAQACAEVGSPPLRNRATVVGNVVTASPANDTLTPLYALGATVTVESVRGERTLPIASFVTGYRTTALAPDELVRSIGFTALGKQPDGTTKRGLFAKLGLRAAAAISVVHVAAVVTEQPDGSVARLAMALGSVGPTVVLVGDATTIAAGRQLGDVADDVAAAARDAATPIDDVRSTAEYRQATVGTLTQRVLRVLASHREAECFGEAASLRLAQNDQREAASLRLAQNDQRAATARHTQPAGTASAHQPAGPDAARVTVDGTVRPAATDGGTSLLDWLRDSCDTLSPKEGCAEGECGACVVQLNGAATFSCLVPAPAAAGSEVVTLTSAVRTQGKHADAGPPETGLADSGHPSFGAAARAVAEALVATNGTQCGFCTPGFVMSAATLLTANPSPAREQVVEALSGNICRCTGYYSIVEAVERAAAQMANDHLASARPSGTQVASAQFESDQ